MPSMQEDLKLDGQIITMLIVCYDLTLTSQEFMSASSLIPSREEISPKVETYSAPLSWPNYDPDEHV